jgi:hypothetical protein
LRPERGAATLAASRPKEARMSTTASALPARVPLLATSVKLDAAMSGAAGAVLAAGAAWLDGPTGIATGWLVGLGLFFLAYAAVLAGIARAGSPPSLVRLVAAANACWVALSVVALVAELQWLAVRRAR